MSDLVAFSSPSERWLAEFLARCSHDYHSSAAYRQALNRERAPLFASTNHNPPRLAA